MIAHSIRSILITVAVVCAVRADGAPVTRTTFYISPRGSDANSGTLARPFASLDRARREIREIRQRSGAPRAVTVYIRGGTYAMRAPVVFEPEDSGTPAAPISFEAFGSDKPVFSGGRRITGWTPGANGIWTAVVPDAARGWTFRQLFVNGQSRRRARTPNTGFYRVVGFPDGGEEVNYHTPSQRFQFKPGDIDPRWTNLEDVEVIVYHFWTDSHLPIQSVDPATNIVTFKHKAGKRFTDDFTGEGARYIVENVLEALDEPGEWYLDRRAGKVYYKPMPGEDMRTVEVIAPSLHEFMRFEGDPARGRLVEDLAFRGLSFLYTNWDLPPGNSNDRQGSASVPAAITLHGTRHVRFDACALENLGTFAFELTEGSTFDEFTRNRLVHLAAGGFRVNGATETGHPLERSGFNRISDNTIGFYGEVFPSAVAVLLMNTEGNTVEHNEIHHGYYTGVSVGWQWGYQRSVSRDNVIAFNHIHDIGQGLLSDMGGIYTLGVSPGTVIRNNVIHDVDANRYGGWGIYNDEGSTHVLVENNLVYRTKFAGYDIHYAREITVRNNVFALGREDQLSRTRMEPHKSVFFETNIVYWTEGKLLSGNWGDKPYSFYFNPMDKNGTRTVESTFDMDWNLYFNPRLSAEQVRFGDATFDQWRSRGKDVHSIYADPLFVDPAHGDFGLRPGSPAFAIGFRAIDLSSVGPRPDPSR
jgi:hypothetical protein